MFLRSEVRAGSQQATAAREVGFFQRLDELGAIGDQVRQRDRVDALGKHLACWVIRRQLLERCANCGVLLAVAQIVTGSMQVIL